jgi:hypothetical protein
VVESLEKCKIKPVKKMKKIIYALIFAMVVVSGFVFANREKEDEASKKPISKPLSAAERKAVMKKWEATPDGVMFKKWEESPEGKKVYAGEAKIRKHLNAFTNMEAVVTSLSLPAGSRLGFGMMVNIDGEDYILSFGMENSDRMFWDFTNEFDQLRNLKVNDKIIIKSHNVSHAPKYLYPIVAGDYVERDGKAIYKRAPRKGGC